MTSNTRLILHGIVLDARNQQLLLPDGTFAYQRVLLVGASSFNRLGENRALPWRPQLMLVAFNDVVLKANGYVAYAKELSVRGAVMRVHLLQHSHDYRKARRVQVWLQEYVWQTLTRQLTHLNIASAKWPARKRHLQARLDDYRNQGGDLQRLLNRFYQAIAKFGASHLAYGVKAGVAACRQAQLSAERELDAKLTVAYLMLAPSKVINVQAPRLDVERALKPHLNDAAQVDDPAYWRQQFQQVQAFKQYYARHQLPLYPPERLAQIQRLHLPYWEAARANVFEALGVLPE